MTIGLRVSTPSLALYRNNAALQPLASPTGTKCISSQSNPIARLCTAFNVRTSTSGASALSSSRVFASRLRRRRSAVSVRARLRRAAVVLKFAAPSVVIDGASVSSSNDCETSMTNDPMTFRSRLALAPPLAPPLDASPPSRDGSSTNPRTASNIPRSVFDGIADAFARVRSLAASSFAARATRRRRVRVTNPAPAVARRRPSRRVDARGRPRATRGDALASARGVMGRARV
jgi:hypothetical protein